MALGCFKWIWKVCGSVASSEEVSIDALSVEDAIIAYLKGWFVTYWYYAFMLVSVMVVLYGATFSYHICHCDNSFLCECGEDIVHQGVGITFAIYLAWTLSFWVSTKVLIEKDIEYIKLSKFKT